MCPSASSELYKRQSNVHLITAPPVQTNSSKLINIGGRGMFPDKKIGDSSGKGYRSWRVFMAHVTVMFSTRQM
jgi:hypothetical protein